MGSGAGNLVRRRAYEAVGGHAAIRNSVVDDVRLAVTLKRRGFRVAAFRAEDRVAGVMRPREAVAPQKPIEPIDGAKVETRGADVVRFKGADRDLRLEFQRQVTYQDDQTKLFDVKVVAENREGRSYTITGTKIFISAGEHDLTDNIIYLVLARLPDAPAGIRGISLFVCPKFIPDSSGDAGPHNAVRCGSIEHKMGIKASATCVMNFDGATAWLVGQPHKGMSAMFTMMNAARLAVGMQGLGIAEAAYQGAVAYAKDRLQMRALSGAKFPDRPADPIIVHPDVRRMLLTMRALTEGCRAQLLGRHGARHLAPPSGREAAGGGG